MLLAEASQFSVDMDSKFVYDNWQKYSNNVAMETGSPLIQILVTIGSTARRLSKIAVRDIKGMFCTVTSDFIIVSAVHYALMGYYCLALVL